MIKMEIRISPFDLLKETLRKKEIWNSNFLKKLQDLNARIDAAPEGNPLANEAKKIKLDQMAEEKTRGCIIRSRAR